MTRAGWQAGAGGWVRRVMLLVAALGLWATAWAQDGAATGAVPASRAAKNVAVITIEGPIDSTTFRSVQRRLKLAERAGADALVIELNTPGGEVGAVLSICDAIRSSTIQNTTAWVNRDAYSGGAIIANACREIVVNDPATFGDALPILAQPMSIFGRINALPDSERQKVLVPILGELVDSARRHGRDEMLVQGIAARGVELWFVENKETGERLTVNAAEYRTLFGEEPTRGMPSLIAAPASPEPAVNSAPAQPGVAEAKPKGRRVRSAPQGSPIGDGSNPFVPAGPDQAKMKGEMAARPFDVPSTRPVLGTADAGKWTLLEYVSTGDGPLLLKTNQMLRYGLAEDIVRNDQELLARFGAKQILRLDASWSEGLVGFLTMLPVRGLLVVVFLLGLFIEMTHPGAALPGAIAIVALVGLLAPPLLINLANWWEVAAILAGIVLVVLELFVIPGFGVPGVLGILLILGGLIGTFVPEGAYFDGSAQREAGLTYGAVTTLLSFITAGVLMYFAAKHFGSLPVLNRLMLKDTTPDDESSEPMLGAMDTGAGELTVGMVGRAVTPLRPSGRVEIDGRIVDVVAEAGLIPAGAQVRVTSVGEFRIGVDRV
jgi:membrane-bound serine protease (ClpP class)